MESWALTRHLELMSRFSTLGRPDALKLFGSAGLARAVQPAVDTTKFSRQMQPVIDALQLSRPLGDVLGLARAVQPIMDATRFSRQMQSIMEAAGMSRSAVNVLGLTRAMQPVIDTSALIKAARQPCAELARALGGAFDVSALTQSMLLGADVARAREFGAFLPAASLPVTGFDEAVRAFAVEVSDRAEMDVVLPDGPIAYAPQRGGEPMPEAWAWERSRSFALDLSTTLISKDDLAYAIRFYAAFFVVLALAQSGNLVEDGPLPDWAVQITEWFVVAATGRALLPKS